MINLHYPSLELCKKLTEELFPNNTEHYDWAFYYDYPNGRNFISDWNPVWLPENPYQQYLCPSVMELLDELPKKFEYKYKFYHLFIVYEWEWAVNIEYKDSDEYGILIIWKDGSYRFGITEANWLAEMWLWLKQNDLLPKK